MNNLNQFSSTPHVTVHDFDLGMKLRWLQKLKKLPPMSIIGIPLSVPSANLIQSIVIAIKSLETIPNIARP